MSHTIAQHQILNGYKSQKQFRQVVDSSSSISFSQLIRPQTVHNDNRINSYFSGNSLHKKRYTEEYPDSISHSKVVVTQEEFNQNAMRASAQGLKTMPESYFGSSPQPQGLATFTGYQSPLFFRPPQSQGAISQTSSPRKFSALQNQQIRASSAMLDKNKQPLNSSNSNGFFKNPLLVSTVQYSELFLTPTTINQHVSGNSPHNPPRLESRRMFRPLKLGMISKNPQDVKMKKLVINNSNSNYYYLNDKNKQWKDHKNQWINSLDDCLTIKTQKFKDVNQKSIPASQDKNLIALKSHYITNKNLLSHKKFAQPTLTINQINLANKLDLTLINQQQMKKPDILSR